MTLSFTKTDETYIEMEGIQSAIVMESKNNRSKERERKKQRACLEEKKVFSILYQSQMVLNWHFGYRSSDHRHVSWSIRAGAIDGWSYFSTPELWTIVSKKSEEAEISQAYWLASFLQSLRIEVEFAHDDLILLESWLVECNDHVRRPSLLDTRIAGRHCVDGEHRECPFNLVIAITWRLNRKN